MRKLNSTLDVTKWITFGRGISSFVLVIVVWEFVSRSGLYNRHLLPPPTEVGSALFQMIESGELITDIQSSLSRYFLGFALGNLLGIVFGMAFFIFFRCT